MILFVFEGADREPDIFRTLERLFFTHPSEEQEKIVIYKYGTSFHSLYNNLNKKGMGLLEHLRDKAASNKNVKLKENYEDFLRYREKDFSEIFLFFDYDFHFKQMSLSQWNEHLETLLSYFDNETENGKLYISYPMVESIRYTKKMPDNAFYTYCVKRSDCMKQKGKRDSGFKYMASSFSDYKGLSFIQWDGMEEHRDEVKQNWENLKFQNVAKANFICNGVNEIPEKKEAVSQSVVFAKQVNKYVNCDECCVSILNAFPLFLFEYFKL